MVRLKEVELKRGGNESPFRLAFPKAWMIASESENCADPPEWRRSCLGTGRYLGGLKRLPYSVAIAERLLWLENTGRNAWSPQPLKHTRDLNRLHWEWPQPEAYDDFYIPRATRPKQCDRQTNRALGDYVEVSYFMSTYQRKSKPSQRDSSRALALMPEYPYNHTLKRGPQAYHHH